MNTEQPYYLNITIAGRPPQDSPATDGAFARQGTTTIFEDLKAALQEMMTIDLYRLDPALCRQKGVPRHFINVSIRNADQQALVELRCARIGADDFHAPEPGMYLYVPKGVGNLEQKTGISLKDLDYYEQEDAYLLLSHYNRDLTALLPCKGYRELAAYCRNDVFMPTRPEPAAPYRLELTGGHYGETIREGDMQGYREFQLQESYPKLNDAFEALLAHDIRSLHANVASREGLESYIDEATIYDATDGQELVAVHRISFDESPDGEPVPGVYLRFPTGITSFQHETGYNFEHFEGFDYAMDLLPIARYGYDDKGYAIIPSATFEQFAHDHEMNRLLSLYDEKDWNFQLRIHARYSEYRDGTKPDLWYQDRPYAFHYVHLEEALLGLLKFDPYTMNEQMSRQHQLGIYITEAAVHDRSGHAIAKLHMVNKGPGQGQDLEPGIYLEITGGMESFQKDYGLHLPLVNATDTESGQRKPSPAAFHQLAAFSGDHQHLLMSDGLIAFQEQLQERIQAREDGKANAYSSRQPAPSPQDSAVPEDKLSYRLQVQWRSTLTDTTVKSKDLVGFPEVEDYKDFSAAFAALQAYNETAYDRDTAKTYFSRAYIHHAAIVDNNDGREILSKFMMPQMRDNMPGGVCIKLEQDKLTLDTLRSIRRHLVSIDATKSPHYLIYEQKARDKAVARRPAEEKKPSSRREMKGPSDRGLSR